MTTPTLMYPKNGTIYLLQENNRKDAHIFDLLEVIAKLEAENANLKAAQGTSNVIPLASAPESPPAEAAG